MGEPRSVEEMNIVEKSMVPAKYQNKNDGRYFTGYSLLEYTTKGLVIRKWMGINNLKYMLPTLWMTSGKRNEPNNYGGSEWCVIAAWDSFPSLVYMMLHVATRPHRSFANMSFQKTTNSKSRFAAELIMNTNLKHHRTFSDNSLILKCSC